MKLKMKQISGFKTELDYGVLNISGDANYGFRPVELLVNAVAGCSGGVLRKVLEKKRISFSTIEIDASIVRDEEGPKKIREIHLHFLINGEALVQETLEKSLKTAIKNCSMAQSLMGSIRITESIEGKDDTFIED
ncbi:OsmC family protein [Fictibacillus fluitans]|uniref:OsmC family protein n=1 Tax=Fictibacillus fluitans TaxID=3058422 RepID=A0ABT8HRE4_9BACL|nr:OsmC family protein [Fictibacillus sp. NE201]MDN4523342.1 OsmC family protein [Fictibacillus sp. NE201]